MPTSTLRPITIGLLLLTACDVTTATRRSLLAECTFNDECAAPLLCAARRCRAPCRTDRDCANDGRCLSAGVVDRFVCYAPDEYDTACVWPSHCLGGRVCSPERICRAQCRADYDCRTLRRDLSCNVSAGVCEGHPFLGDAGSLVDVLRNDPGPNVDPIVGASVLRDAGVAVDAGAATDTGTPTDRGGDAPASSTCPVVDTSGACRPGMDPGCDVVDVSIGKSGSGSSVSCAVLSDGSVRCWGRNLSGELVGTSAPCGLPGVIPGLRGVRRVSVGGLGVCALTATQALCWGLNGELGLGGAGSDRTLTPTAQAMAVGATAEVTGNGYGACVWEPGGPRRCWGINSDGLLGNGTSAAVATPTLMPEPSAVRGVSFGSSHACAVAADGRVWCWGTAHRVDGGPDAGAATLSPSLVPGLSDVTQVAVGWNGSCVLDGAGTVRCWGNGSSGQLGRPVPGGTDLTPGAVVGLPGPVDEIATTSASTCARLRTSGEVWCWGRGTLGDPARSTSATSSTPLRVPGLSGVRRVFAGVEGYCVLLAGADLRCWGLVNSGVNANPGVIVLGPTAVSW